MQSQASQQTPDSCSAGQQQGRAVVVASAYAPAALLRLIICRESCKSAKLQGLRKHALRQCNVLKVNGDLL